MSRQKETFYRIRLFIFTAILLIVSIICLLSNRDCKKVSSEEFSSSEEETEQLTDRFEEPTTEEETEEPTTTNIRAVKLSAEEENMLLKIAMAEAEGEPTEGKALVMLVILNRVADKHFPDTIEEVIFQKSVKANGRVSYQFSPTKPNGRYYTTEPNDDCFKALEMVYEGWDESYGALYFDASKGNKETWHTRTLEFLFIFEGHRFFR